MRLTLILLCLTMPLFSATLFQIDSVPGLAGNREIRSGEYEYAKRLISQTKSVDHPYQMLKEAELAILKKDYSEAKRYLLAVISQSSDLTPFAYRRIGDIELMQFDPSHAIVAYRTAAEKTEIKPYRFLLVNRADSLTKVYESALKSGGWHSLPYRDTIMPPREPLVDSILERYKIRLAEGVTEVQLDSLMKVAAKAGRGMDLKKAMRDTAIIREPFSLKRIYEHSRFLNEIGAYADAGRWIGAASVRPGFADSVNQKEYLEFRANLNYTLKIWENVGKYTEEYFKSYGYTADLLLKTARAYRNAGMESTADYWYNECVRRFPNQSESRDVLWYQAWQAEERGKYDSAVVRFRNIARYIPDYKYADDAAFRIGLNQYRQRLFSDAIGSFQDFAQKHPKSDLVPGASYWQGRCYAALKNDSMATLTYRKTISEWPLDYYGWRSRQALGILDSATLPASTFDSWYDQVKKISRDPEDSKGPANSMNRFRRAVQLGTLGYFDEARLLIEPVEIRSSKNPAQLFELSRFYEMIGEHNKAFRVTKNVYFSLPQSLRKNISPEFLNRLYPRAYPEAVSSSSAKFGVDQHLVRSIMRQESMFNPVIKSPVGAVGLMQIMPYTAKQIADDLDTSYNDNMLLTPEVNVKFGTYYIGMLLKQFDGNFVRAIASYNGGPNNVKKWAELNEDIAGDDPFFTECIGFSETRNYVKRVLENYWIYRTLNRTN